MAASDGPMRTMELWNDGPAVQATLGQMQHFQAQMQQQLQEQLAQIQQQMGSLQPAQQQPARGLQAPFWPLQQVPPQMPFQQAGPPPKLQRTRASRLGKRERAGLKAARSTHQAEQAEQKSGDSEAEASAGGWQRVHAEGAAREKHEKISVEAVHHLMEAFGKALKAEMEDNLNEFKKTSDEVMLVVGEKLATVICECKGGASIALARLKTDLKAEVASTCKAAIEAALSSVKLADSEHVGRRADFELRTEALASKQITRTLELRGLMQDGMRRMATKTDALGSSVQHLQLDLQRLQALSSELSHRSHQVLEEMRGSMKGLQDSVDRARATVKLLSDRSATASETERMQDAIGQCDDSVGQEVDVTQSPKLAVDSFDPLAKGARIVLANDNAYATHSGNAWRHEWNTVYGKHLVQHGKYEWQLQIEDSQTSGGNVWQMVVGVAPTSANENTSLSSSGRGHGYIQLIGAKTDNSNEHLGSNPYAQGYASGDVVAVVLDMTSRQLSFKKNQQDLGVSHSVSSEAHRLAVSLGSSGHAVRLLSSGPL